MIEGGGEGGGGLLAVTCRMGHPLIGGEGLTCSHMQDGPPTHGRGGAHLQSHAGWATHSWEGRGSLAVICRMGHPLMGGEGLTCSHMQDGPPTHGRGGAR